MLWKLGWFWVEKPHAGQCEKDQGEVRCYCCIPEWRWGPAPMRRTPQGVQKAGCHPKLRFPNVFLSFPWLLDMKLGLLGWC